LTSSPLQSKPTAQTVNAHETTEQRITRLEAENMAQLRYLPCELVEVMRSLSADVRPKRRLGPSGRLRIPSVKRGVGGPQSDNTVGAPRVTAELDDGAPDDEPESQARRAGDARGRKAPGHVKGHA
jgi:hypothetical protein